MRSRTIREGSVGFLILLGLGLFGGLALWLRGVQLGTRSYKAVVEFASAQGLQMGTPVRYRGVSVGKVTGIKPGANGVDVTLEISPPDLVIPRDVVIEANKSGLIGEGSIDMMPRSLLSQSAVAANPLDPNCPDVIICNNSRLQGQAGVTVDELIRSTVRFSNLYSDPELFANIKSIAQNTSLAAQGAAQLTRDLSSLSQSMKVEVGNLSQSVRGQLGDLTQSVKGELGSLNQSVQTELGGVATDIRKVSATADTSTKAVTQAAIASANSVSQAANQISLTASQLNALIVTNRSTLVATLNNINQTSEELRVAVNGLSPVLDRVQQGQLINNLEVLAANAAQASANLRDLSSAVNNPTNLLVLQQTLDSARATFQNVQKITSDLDELTGDPAFRNNIRKLVNSLGGLLGSTQQLQQTTAVAQNLEALEAQVKAGNPQVVGKKWVSGGEKSFEVKNELMVGSPQVGGEKWMKPDSTVKVVVP